MAYSCVGTICGGLPVWVTVTGGTDDYTGEGWSEVVSIKWLKRDGTPGKDIPQKVWERAEAYDWRFCDLTLNAWEQCAYEQYERENREEFEKALPILIELLGE